MATSSRLAHRSTVLLRAGADQGRKPRESGREVTEGALRRKLRDKGIPASASLAIVGQAQLAAPKVLAEAVRRAWWPLALLTLYGRVLMLAAFVPGIVEAASNRRGLRWMALRIADDLAYCTGVWMGCVRHRTVAPLLPRFTG